MMLKCSWYGNIDTNTIICEVLLMVQDGQRRGGGGELKWYALYRKIKGENKTFLVNTKMQQSMHDAVTIAKCPYKNTVIFSPAPSLK